MGDTKIEWTEKTWNPVRGCSVVSEGCRNCYAMNFATRFAGKDEAYEGLAYRNESGAHWTGKVRLIEEHLNDPLRWKKPVRVFVNSMSDLFHESLSDEEIDCVFAVMARAPQHTFQVLTKRPQRMLEYFTQEESPYFYACTRVVKLAREEVRKRGDDQSDIQTEWPLPNVWLGVSVEDQKTAEERIPLLLQTPAAVKWISAEPLLGPIELEAHPRHWLTINSESLVSCSSTDLKNHLDWVVVGGESGPKARPMHPDWARSLRDQCVAAGVPFFFKQWGEYLPESQVKGDQVFGTFSQGSNKSKFKDAEVAYRMGKKAAGRLLDGVEWNQYPATTGISTTGV